MRIKLSGRVVVMTAISVSLACLIAAGLFLSGRAIRQKTATPSARPVNVIHYSTPTPAETPATSQTYHSTAVGDQPKYMRLPTIGAEGYVQAVGIDQHGAVAAPNNVSLAGWYADMLKPGQAGLSIIDGHVDGKTARGIFYNLHKLAAGDAVEIDLANGQTVHYSVKSVNQVSASDAASKLFERDNSITGQLNLITCGGTFNRTAGAYTDRIIVVAAQN
jgi:LPXTG-site transpeptidase (sortase) family protein